MHNKMKRQHISRIKRAKIFFQRDFGKARANVSLREWQRWHRAAVGAAGGACGRRLLSRCPSAWASGMGWSSRRDSAASNSPATPAPACTTSPASLQIGSTQSWKKWMMWLGEQVPGRETVDSTAELGSKCDVLVPLSCHFRPALQPSQWSPSTNAAMLRVDAADASRARLAPLQQYLFTFFPRVNSQLGASTGHTFAGVAEN